MNGAAGDYVEEDHSLGFGARMASASLVASESYAYASEYSPRNCADRITQADLAVADIEAVSRTIRAAVSPRPEEWSVAAKLGASHAYAGTAYGRQAVPAWTLEVLVQTCSTSLSIAKV